MAGLIDEEGIPSIALSVVRDGKIVWEEGFGQADVQGNLVATADVPYSLASVSKPVTATGLMVLVERGLVDLDAPVNRYLGEHRLRTRVGNAEDATVRRVANHTAGLPLHYQFFWSDRDAARPPMPVTIARWGNLVTAPGERYEYSNLGYGILEYLIERVSGQGYPAFLAQEVLGPLDMSASSVPLPPGPDGRHARRYGPGGARLPFYDFDHRGASAVYSSAHDLALFALFHLGHAHPDEDAILSLDAIGEMQVGTAAIRPASAYGIGWMITTRPDGRRIVGHGGGMGGVSTSLVLAPGDDLAVAVLMNARGPWPSRISDAVLDRLLPRLPEGDREDPTRAGGADPVAAAREGDARAADGRRSRRAEGEGPPGRSRAEGEGPPGRSRAEGDGPPGRFRREAGEGAGLQPLVGRWEGSVDDPRDPRGPVAVSLEVGGDGEVRMRLDGGPWMELLAPRFRDGFLTARTPSGYDPDDPGRVPRFLQLDVRLRGDVLNGSLTTLSRPEDRTGNALTSWIELERRRGTATGRCLPRTSAPGAPGGSS